jgi:hypothetical protein
MRRTQLRTIRSWNDLEEFGIVALTGEACGYSMRILCDVTTVGKAFLERFFGGNVQIRDGSNWNGKSSAGTHVGSVLLPYSILSDLGAFLLAFTAGPESVVCSLEGGTVVELDGQPEDMEETGRGIIRYYKRSDAPGTGDRNRHAASGRVE